ncbi:MAG: hypothetical protein ACHQ7M_10150 [Chloroflexota bacterium]
MWRLQTEDDDATAIRAFDDERPNRSTCRWPRCTCPCGGSPRGPHSDHRRSGGTLGATPSARPDARLHLPYPVSAT